VGLPPTAPGDDGRVVEGLRLPERPSVPAAPALLVVRPGDSLWGIAERLLPAGASDADVDRRWRSLYRHNHEVVGPDPDHIEPRMTLHVPKEY
jgi:nucleoid-associated protein YgaU